MRLVDNVWDLLTIYRNAHNNVWDLLTIYRNAYNPPVIGYILIHITNAGATVM